MADEASGAIWSKPVFRFLAVADFCGTGSPPDGWPLRIEKTTFEEVLARFAPGVQLSAPDCLTGGRKPLDFPLSFRTMADFQPLPILERAEATRPYLAACRVLRSVARREASVADALARLRNEQVGGALLQTIEGELKKSVADSSPGKGPSAGGGDVLASVGMAGAPADASGGLLQSLLADLDIPQHAVSDRTESAAAARLLGDLCDRLHRQLDAILHAPAFQSLESAWRGLQLLVTRTDFQNCPIELWVCPSNRDDLPAAMTQGFTTLRQTASDEGLVAALVDFSFDQSAEDIGFLALLSALGEDYYCLVAAQASANLLGGASQEYADLPASLRQRFDAPDLIAWREFCRSDAASHLALVVPEVLGRGAYGPKTTPVADIAYQEKNGALWVRGVWALGAGLVQSISKTGWCLSFTGQPQGRVDGLPTTGRTVGSRTVHSAARAVWTDEQRTELARAGLVVLEGQPNQTHVTIVSAPTLYEPAAQPNAEATREARLYATVPFRLFGNLLAQRLRNVQGTLTPAMTPEDSAQRVGEAIASLFERPDGVRVAVQSPQAAGQRPSLAISVRPPFAILGREPELDLSFELPG